MLSNYKIMPVLLRKAAQQITKQTSCSTKGSMCTGSELNGAYHCGDYKLSRSYSLLMQEIRDKASGWSIFTSGSLLVFLDPEGGSRNATLVVLLVVVISSLASKNP